MLQYITHESSRFSIPEQVQMVIEAGCRWIQLRMKNASDEDVRNVALEIIPLCRDTDTFLIIDDRVDLVNDLKVSGVHLGKTDMPPAQARELLGPHAIIGVTANTIDDILAVRDLDVDYIGVGPFAMTRTKENLAPVLGLDGYKTLVTEARNQGISIPLVAVGGIKLDDVKPIMATGMSGIAVSGAILRADDPVIATAKFLEKLNN